MSTPGAVRILIADDHPIFRDGLRKLLETEPGFHVVGQAEDGGEAVRLARELNPDVLLLDLAMPRLPGLDTLRQLPLATAPIRIIMLTAAIDLDEISEALRLGARGVVLKESATELLFESIHSVMEGRYWIGRESVSDLDDKLRRLAAEDEGSQRQSFGLTPRELQLLPSIVSGCTNKEIAREFGLSEQTVKHHLAHIFDKTGVSNRLELALFIIHHGLVGRRRQSI